MQDFGEQTDVNWHFHDGETGAHLHNLYPILYDRATRKILDGYMRTHPRRHIFFFTRAGYSGTPGSAAYENAEFLGDNTTSWDPASGIASVVPDELNRGVGGAFGPDTDIGGYLDLLDPPTTPDLFDRWAELSALTPFFRVHNSGETGTLMPWALGPRTLAVYRAMLRLHVRAEPLILTLWAQADRTGVPVMRPLWLADPSNPVAAGVAQEWELGPNVLVAPVVTQHSSSQRVVFPHGCWRREPTGATYRGPRTATVRASLDQLPYFTRCGTHPFGTRARVRSHRRRRQFPARRASVRAVPRQP
jgi:alpha-glucosidase (family GH31 glycosyl hydrolase)